MSFNECPEEYEGYETHLPLMTTAPYFSERLTAIDRTAQENAIMAIPAWKRFLICAVMKRREWRIARAYNTVAVHAVGTLGDYELFAMARDHGDRVWASIYNLKR